MRSESGDQGLLEDPELGGTSKQSHEGSKISYSRDLLLSLRRTERCKKFPRDFDPSMLGGFEDASTGLLMSPLDSDSGPLGSLSRGLMRSPANDELWESGRCIATASSSKVQCSNNYNILHKTHNPYRPPHFYKVASLVEHKAPEGKEMQPEKHSGPNDQLCETRDSEEVYSCKDLEQYISSEVYEKSTNDHAASTDKGLKLTKTSSDELNLKSNTDKNSLNVSGNRDTAEFGSSLPRKITFGTFSAVEVKSSFASVIHKDRVVVSAVSDDVQPENEEAEFSDEINLPDEDSLFTFDYSIFDDPDEEADLLPSSTQVDLIRKLATLSHINPHYAMGMETYVYQTMACFRPWNSMDSRHCPNNHHWYPRNGNLPDEDSLFTFDYSIFDDPDEEADLLPSSTQVDLIRKLATLSHINPHYAMGMETYVYQTMACFRPWNSMDSRHCPNNHHWYPRNGQPPYPFQQPRPWSARFGSPINHSHFNPMHFPSNFPYCHLQNGFQRGFPYRPVTQLPHSPQRLSYQQTGYGSHGKQISGQRSAFGGFKNKNTWIPVKPKALANKVDR